jgi:DNA adenine methylase
MKYMGGKHRVAKHIVPLMLPYIKDTFYEPFVGACNIVPALRKAGFEGHAYCSDAHAALITMWQHLQQGWQPPAFVTEAEYKAARLLPDTDPHKAFIGFACSWGGKYFGGYARDGRDHRGYAQEGINGLRPKVQYIYNTTFTHQSFFDPSFMPRNSVVYCDPPYADTTKFTVGSFDTEAFWQKVRILAETNVVFISEHTAPDDIPCVWEKTLYTDIRRKDGKKTRNDCLFMIGAS